VLVTAAERDETLRLRMLQRKPVAPIALSLGQGRRI